MYVRTQTRGDKLLWMERNNIEQNNPIEIAYAAEVMVHRSGVQASDYKNQPYP